MEHRETLTHRERVRRAVAHEPVDRTPIDLGVHYSTGISAFAYQNLREYLGLPYKPAEIIDPFQFLSRVDEDVLERFHCDCICFHPGYPQTKLWNPRENYEFLIPEAIRTEKAADGSWTFSDRNGGGRARMPAGGFFFDGGYFNAWPEGVSYIDAVAKKAEQIYKETDYYTLYLGGLSSYSSEDIDWMVDFTQDPDQTAAGFQEIHRRNTAEITELWKKAGEHIQGVCVGCDLGTQTAPMCRPSLYDDYVAPWLRKFCTFLHENTSYKLFFHSCGAMEPFIRTMIDCGVDILNPVQISCANMEPHALKEKYGSQICFWGGGCDTQHVLGTGTPEEVAVNVKELFGILAPDSGFVFNQVHNIMGNVPPRNIAAMLDAAYDAAMNL